MVSPMYKDIHRSHIVICTWEFKKFKHVELKRLVIFDEFVLKNSSLVVKGSEAQDGIYTGNKSPPNIVAIGNTTFEFHLNTSISGEKFAFTFSVKGSQEKDIDDSGNRKTLCGEISHGGENGTLSPEHGQINAGRSCIWEINCEAIPSTKEIFLSFEEFDLADNDSFTILDITGKIIFGPYSGEKEQFSILTGVKALTAELQISKSLPSFIRRFKVNYNAKVCVNQITAKVGIGICPLYNSSNNRMNENVSCSWLFNLPEDTVQSISFEKFSIPGGQLFVTGNVDPKQSYSGKVHPSDMFIKRTGNITLNFNTLFQNEFLFTYNEVMPECSSYIQLTEENSFAWISSPTYDDSFDGWTNCQWIIQSPGSSVVAFKINRINLTDVQDFIIIKDGNSRLSPLLLQITHNNQETVKNSYLISSHNTMWISFSSQFLIKGSQFQAEVNISKHGGYYRNNGSITIHSSSLGNDIIYFLEVQNNQQVYLTVSEESFFTSGIVEIYDDFSINASLLTTLRSKKYFYPIVSTSFKMMLVGKNFGQNSSIELNFKGIEKGCHKITLENNGVYSVIGNCNRTCSWIIPPKEQDESEKSKTWNLAYYPKISYRIFYMV
ncbi:cubilin-like [Centruroides sculpturatus]|uniref:cubilin-like n=1 Tax=Centruroides sculpturatus TaxID=218467 RepID=UPI000C6DC278|nr:cubilin-like [Centruroides sculpturatus]